MGFTKAQRLKGLKKQLKNLGYDMVSRGGSSPPEEPETDSSPAGEDTERGAKTLARMTAQEESW